MQAVDCEGFAGGFTLGVVRAGFKLAGKRELPGGFGVASCESNRHLLGDAWRTQISSAAEWEPVQVPLVFGNPPCSGFSLLSRADFRGSSSPINSCMIAFADYAARCNAEVAIFESVQPAYKQGRDLMQHLRGRMEDATGTRYDLIHVLHNAAALGGAAIRKRYFFVASRVPFGVDVDRPRRIPRLFDSIGDLEGLATTWLPQPYRRPRSWWARQAREAAGSVDGHYARVNPLIQRTTDLMLGTDWDQGENIEMVSRRYYARHGCLPPSWTRAEKVIANEFRQGFYQMHRWRYDQPARVVTGAASLLVLHPTEPRVLSYRESARIQGFPDSWRIAPLRGKCDVAILWGKGIPVHCGRWIADAARSALNGEPGSIRGTDIGERERVIDVTNAHAGVPVG